MIVNYVRYFEYTAVLPPSIHHHQKTKNHFDASSVLNISISTRRVQMGIKICVPTSLPFEIFNVRIHIFFSIKVGYIQYMFAMQVPPEQKENKTFDTVQNPLRKKEDVSVVVSASGECDMLSVEKVAALKLHAKKAHERTKENLSKNFTVRKIERRITGDFYSHHWVLGAPPTHMNYKIGIEMFLVHLLYPLGPIYIYLRYGKKPFRNLAFTCHSPQAFFLSHLPFIISLIAALWVLADRRAREIYGHEVVVMWLSQISRLLGVGVKYAFCDPEFFHSYLHSEDAAAVELAAKNLMLPSGWFSPSLEQWLPVIDRAEHMSNVSFCIQGMTIGKGLSQDVMFAGKENVEQMLEFIKPYKDLDEVKSREFHATEGRGVEGYMASKSIPTLRVSIGLLLIAMVMDKRKDSKPFCFHPFVDMALNSLFISLCFVCVGIFHRIFALGQPGQGDHEAAGFFIFSIVYVSLFNYWAFF